jgi:6,7-dimethyl-8-ribityllumazine synthase
VKGLSDSAESSRLTASELKQVAGSHDARGLRFGIVVSRFNEALTKRLAETAVSCLKEHGAKEGDLTVVWVPGAFEIPLALQRLAERRWYAALIALGAVVQGETPHASLITTEVTHALGDLSRKHNLPVIDGVVSALNWAQAEARAGAREKNRGWYAARAAIEMANLMKQL